MSLELIVYAVPRGPLGECLEEWFRRASTVAATNAALAYPPHCTVTGFFRAEASALTTHAQALERLVQEAVEGDARIEVLGLRNAAGWIGIELRAAWLTQLARGLRDAVSSSGLEAIRPKDWLHVSLSYDHPPQEHSTLVDLAEQCLDVRLPARWDLVLYERHAGGWTDHARWPLPPSA